MFHVHRSNRVEELQRALSQLLIERPSSPFAEETIVVSSAGMERWLRLRLADDHGICANVRFPFPRAFVESVIDTVLADEPGASAVFAPESLVFALLPELERIGQDPELGPVRTYLGADSDEMKRAELAGRIARLFDQYAVYRPDMVLDWERGRDGGWQAELWRAIVARLGPRHLAARSDRFVRRLAELPSRPPALPERISVFGVSTLPPVHLGILGALARCSEVHLFLLCPSDERWRALSKQRSELRALVSRPGVVPELARAEGLVGEPRGLLAAMSRTERELQHVLEVLVDYDERSTLFVPPGESSLLARLQSELQRERSTPGFAAELPVSDASVSIHACHGPMREVEVLRDQLLALFQDDPTLSPHDVVVMTPDIELYAPLVHAVFGCDSDEPGHIPFRIADRAQRAASPVARAVLDLLEVLSGRFKAGEVVDLLELEPVRARTGIEPDALSRLERWLADAGVRWGVDGAHRAELGLPDVDENTWRFGLTRLLLGAALPGRESQVFAGALPFDAVEGSSALMVGQLAELVEKLARWRERFRAPRSPSAWQSDMLAVVDDLLEIPEADGWQLALVRDAIAAIVDAADRAGYEAPLGMQLFATLLESGLESTRLGHDLVSGAVTFCALVPMHGIPFRVVCLLGMNDGEFPRSDRSPTFDLLAREPRVADPSVRDEDRYLFLEALLSAREKLLVTYVGRGIQDDAPRPPSGVISELVEAAEACRAARAAVCPAQLELFSAAPKATPAEPPVPLVLEHPLQAFSERYFEVGRDPRLFSFGDLELSAARARREGVAVEPPFFPGALPPLDEAEVDLDQVVRFFEHPTRQLLESRLGLALRERDETLAEREPMELGPLERHRIGSFLLERYLAGADDQRAYELARAAGILPHAAAGRVACAAIATEARSIAEAALRRQKGERRPPLSLRAPLGGRTLVGKLGGVWSGGRLEHTYSRTKARSKLALWIRHLALQLADGADVPRASAWLGRDRKAGTAELRLAPIEREKARALLAQLAGLRQLGLSAPLPLFPESALAYAEALARHGDEENARELALGAARAVFSAKGQAHAESDDPFIAYLYGAQDPLQPGFSLVPGAGLRDFGELSVFVFGPLLGRLEQEATP